MSDPKPTFPYNEHPPFACPHCGTLMDSSTTSQFQAYMPKDGDLSLCVQCLEPATFVVGPLGVALRKSTPDELAEFEVDHAHVRRALAEVKHRYPDGPP